MNDYGFVRQDLTAAAGAADDAVATARGADGADSLTTMAGGLPGTQTAAYLPTLADLWRDGIADWCSEAESFAEAIAGAERDGTTTDNGIGDWFGIPGLGGG